MEALAERDRSQTASQMLPAPGERRRVGDGEVEAHHPEQSVQEPFGLTQREMGRLAKREANFFRLLMGVASIGNPRRTGYSCNNAPWSVPIDIGRQPRERASRIVDTLDADRHRAGVRTLATPAPHHERPSA